MAISYPLTPPTESAQESITITPRSVVTTTRSPFTREVEVFEYPGQWWEIEVIIMAGQRADIEPWVAFLLELNGQFGTFLLGEELNTAPRGAASSTPGTPIIKGASQTGNDINIDDAPNSITDYLKAGDWLQFGSGSTARLYKQLQDVSSNGSGDVALTLWPKVTAADTPADNSAVVLTSPVGLFRLAGNAMPYPIRGPDIYELSFSAISEVG